MPILAVYLPALPSTLAIAVFTTGHNRLALLLEHRLDITVTRDQQQLLC